MRIGFAQARELAHLFYTHHVDVGPKEQHAIDRYLKLIAAVGCPSGPVEFVFNTTERDRAGIAEKIGHDRPYAVLLPGTNWPTKRWPAERFAALARAIRERFGLEPLVAGSPNEGFLAQQIGGTNLAGKTSLRELVALLERAQLVVANDSGPMHIASALNRPLVAIFGPTNPVRTGPFGRADSVIRLDIPCSPCYSRRCSHQSCLQWLGIEPVLQLARTQLELHAHTKVQHSVPGEMPAST